MIHSINKKHKKDVIILIFEDKQKSEGFPYLVTIFLQKLKSSNKTALAPDFLT